MMSEKKRVHVTFGDDDQKSFEKVLGDLPEKYKGRKGFLAFVKDGYYKLIEDYLVR